MFEYSPAKDHDSIHYIPFKSLKNKLIIHDLGYWDFFILSKIEEAKGFFLSRVKKTACLTITKAISGIGKHNVGKDLLSIPFKRKSGNIIEAMVCLTNSKEYRCIGFWNKKEKIYHWYINNLRCNRWLISPLYKLRWQSELSFKACKSFMNLDSMPTTNSNTVIVFMLLSIINYQFSCIIRENGKDISDDAETINSMTLLRSAKITLQLINQIASFLLEGTNES